MNPRLAQLRDKLVAYGVDGFLSLDAVTNSYLSGFSGSTSAIAVTLDRAIFITDFRYTEQARMEVTGFKLREATNSLTEEISTTVRHTGARKVGFEPDRLSFKSYQELREKLGSIELEPTPALVSNLRAVKDRAELDAIRRAAEIASRVIGEVPSMLREGISETDLAAELEYRIRKSGAADSSFDTIALFGERSCLPHGKPSTKRLKSGDLMMVDLGARVDGYNSDLTRTWVYRRIQTARAEEIYAIVQTAQQAALRAVRAGMSCAELDAAARSVIEKSGYGTNFGHGLGHGVGLEIHESPRISAKSTDRLEDGMVITIEPAIYIPGEGGVRIEDLVLVTRTGCQILTDADKSFAVV